MCIWPKYWSFPMVSYCWLNWKEKKNHPYCRTLDTFFLHTFFAARNSFIRNFWLQNSWAVIGWMWNIRMVQNSYCADCALMCWTVELHNNSYMKIEKRLHRSLPPSEYRSSTTCLYVCCRGIGYYNIHKCMTAVRLYILWKSKRENIMYRMQIRIRHCKLFILSTKFKNQ